MPHDKNGNLLVKGDRVSLECVVKEVTSQGEEYCNVTLETVEPMYPGTHKTVVTANAKQVVRIGEDAGG
jgi:hypothetical protein